MDANPKSNHPKSQGGAGEFGETGRSDPKDPCEPFHIAPLLRVLLGALLGSVVMAVMVVLPGFVLHTLVGRSEAGGFVREVSTLVADLLRNAAFTPWGLIGALIGAAIVWRRLRRHAAESRSDLPSRSTQRRRFLQPGELKLALGFLLLLVALSLYPSVMVYFLSLWILPPALILLASGTAAARSSAGPFSRRFTGFWLLLLGLATLSFAAFTGTHLSYQLAESARIAAQGIPRPAPEPALTNWAWFAATCVLSSLLIAPGLRFWTDWSRARRFGWSVGLFAFPIFALILHRTLAGAGLLPLSA